MKPTNKLRFVVRVVPAPEYGGACIGGQVRILQQWWEDSRHVNLGFGDIPINDPIGEWRDVPVEEE